jgi:mono/diheme cytochrome c family protein
VIPLLASLSLLAACGGGGSTAGAPAATAAGGAAAAGNATNGKALFASSGCASCHTISGTGGKIGPDLTAVGSRLSVAQISDQLNDPKQRPAPYTQVSGPAAMPKPAFAGNPSQVADVAAYLASLKG